MDNQDHIELAMLLSSLDGMVAVSGYHCDLMDELYAGWTVHEEGIRKVHSVKQDRLEVLWTNY